MRGLEGAYEDVVVIADADVVCDPTRALEQVRAGAPWAVPHDQVRRLDQTGTLAALRNFQLDEDLPLDEPPYRGIECGGMVVAKRETLLDVPPDARFIGWGQEDECWAVALKELVGEPWRGTETLYHLWHPPQDRYTRVRGSIASWDLKIRYMDARGHPEQMRALVEEGRVRQPA